MTRAPNNDATSYHLLRHVIKLVLSTVHAGITLKQSNEAKTQSSEKYQINIFTVSNSET
jgi:hypothetical protein